MYFTTQLTALLAHHEESRPEFDPTTTADFFLAQDAELVGRLALIAVKDRPISVQHCTLSGAGIENALVGHSAVFTITAHGHDGGRLQDGGAQFAVDVQIGDDNVAMHASTQDNEDGTYTVTYDVPEEVAAETLVLSVQHQGTHLPGSPCAVQVSYPLESDLPCLQVGHGNSAVNDLADPRTKWPARGCVR